MRYFDLTLTADPRYPGIDTMRPADGFARDPALAPAAQWRNMIGAVVDEQPFGGEGLSGTGPRAGGPD